MTEYNGIEDVTQSVNWEFNFQVPCLPKEVLNDDLTWADYDGVSPVTKSLTTGWVSWSSGSQVFDRNNDAMDAEQATGWVKLKMNFLDSAFVDDYVSVGTTKFSEVVFDWETNFPTVDILLQASIYDEDQNVLWTQVISGSDVEVVVSGLTQFYSLALKVLSGSGVLEHGDWFVKFSNVKVKKKIWKTLNEYVVNCTELLRVGAGGWKFGFESIDSYLKLFARIPERLSSGITETQTSLPLTNTEPYPYKGSVKLENEVIHYENKNAGFLLQCVRGWEGTTPAAHGSGVQVIDANWNWVWRLDMDDEDCWRVGSPDSAKSIMFDYSYCINDDFFVFELLDGAGDLQWTGPACSNWETVTGSISITEWDGKSWTFRLRAKQALTASTILSNDMDEIQDYAEVASTAGFPSWGVIEIGSERMKYTHVSDTQFLGLTRGYEGTTPALHFSNDYVFPSLTWFGEFSSIMVDQSVEAGAVTGQKFKVSNIKDLEVLLAQVSMEQPKQRTIAYFKMRYSLDGTIWSDWLGPDSTVHSYFGVGEGSRPVMPWLMVQPLDYRSIPVLPAGSLHWCQWKCFLVGDRMVSPKIGELWFAADKFLFGVDTLDTKKYGVEPPLPIDRGVPLKQWPTRYVFEGASLSTSEVLSIVTMLFEFTGRVLTLELFEKIRGWIEAIVGKVCSGYVINQFEQKIPTPWGGFVELLFGSFFQPQNTAGHVNTESFYQVFLTGDYDDWHLVVTFPNWVDKSYRKCPDAESILVEEGLPDSKDLCFCVPKLIEGETLEAGGCLKLKEKSA